MTSVCNCKPIALKQSCFIHGDFEPMTMHQIQCAALTAGETEPGCPKCELEKEAQ